MAIYGIKDNPGKKTLDEGPVKKSPETECENPKRGANGTLSCEFDFGEMIIDGDTAAEKLIKEGRLQNSVSGALFRRNPGDEVAFGKRGGVEYGDKKLVEFGSIKKISEKALKEKSRPVEMRLYLDASGSMEENRILMLSQVGHLLQLFNILDINVSLSLSLFEGGKTFDVMPMREMDGEGIVEFVLSLFNKTEVIGGDETIYAAIEEGHSYFLNREDVTPIVIVLTDDEADKNRRDITSAAAASRDGITVAVMRDIKKELSLDARGEVRSWLEIAGDISYTLGKFLEVHGEKGIAHLKHMAKNSRYLLFRIAAYRAMKPASDWTRAIEAVYYDKEWQREVENSRRGSSHSWRINTSWPEWSKSPRDSVIHSSAWIGHVILQDIGTKESHRLLSRMIINTQQYHFMSAESFASWEIDPLIFLDVYMSYPYTEENFYFDGSWRGLFKLMVPEPSVEVINEIVKKIDHAFTKDYTVGISWLRNFKYIDEVKNSAILQKRITDIIHDTNNKQWSQAISYSLDNGLVSADEGRKMLREVLSKKGLNEIREGLVALLPEIEQNSIWLQFLICDDIDFARHAHKVVQNLSPERKALILDAAVRKGIPLRHIREEIRTDAAISSGAVLRMNGLAVEYMKVIPVKLTAEEYNRWAKKEGLATVTKNKDHKFSYERYISYDRELLPTAEVLLERLKNAIVFGKDIEKEKPILDFYIEKMREDAILARGLMELNPQFLPEQFEYLINELSNDEGNSTEYSDHIMVVIWRYYRSYPKSYRNFLLRELPENNLPLLRKKQLFRNFFNYADQFLSLNYHKPYLEWKAYAEGHESKVRHEKGLEEDYLAVKEEYITGEAPHDVVKDYSYIERSEFYEVVHVFLQLATDKRVDKSIRRKALYYLAPLDAWCGYRTIREPLKKLAEDSADPLYRVAKKVLKDVEEAKPRVIPVPPKEKSRW